MSERYVLDEAGNPQLEPNLMTWARWFENSQNRVVKQDMIGDVKVSTVFLGLNHNFGLDGPPVLWETMIFGGEHDDYQDRYTTHEDALKGHQAAIELVRTAEASR
jgi:hypothetical protein